MRILLVTFHFPPATSAGAVRASKTAQHLRTLGHDVRILTSSGNERGVTAAPWARVNYPVDLLLGGSGRVERKGYQVTGPLRRPLSWLGSVYRWAFNVPDRYVGWVPFALRAGNRIMRDWRPDLILGTAKPLSALLVASSLARFWGVPWVAELRDLWVDNHCYPFSGLRRWLERKLERAVLGSAVGLCTISEPLAETLRARYSQPVAVVLHGVDPEDYAREVVPASAGPLQLLYTGSVYPHFQDPTPLFEAMRDLEGAVRVRFLGRGLSWVAERAAREGVSAWVEILPVVPHQECLTQMRAADLLLLLLWGDPLQKGVYTTKLFDYLGARRPILAVGESGNVASDLILERGLGTVESTREGLVARLRELLESKGRTGRLPETPAEAIAGLSRLEQVVKLEAFLRRMALPGGAASAAD